MLYEVIGDLHGHADALVPDHKQSPYIDNRPLFVGHYWETGNPTPLAKNVACVDYSVAKNGRLVAYRWEGEDELDPKRFLWV